MRIGQPAPVVILAALMLACVVAAALPEPPLVCVPQVADSAVPDWDRAAVAGPFVRSDGTGMPLAAASARLCRTATALKLRLVCIEPRMDKVRAARRDRDSEVWTDDCVEVFLQRPGDGGYFHFIVNTLGTPFDEQGRDARWNGDWEAKATKEKDRWQVDLTLPWATLGGAPEDGAVWRLNVCRSRTVETECSSWSPTGGGFHVPDRFGTIRFSAEPWPTAVEWALPRRTTGTVQVAWQPDGVAAGIELRVNGAKTAGEFPIAAEGAVALSLEALAGGKPVLRAVHVVEVTPVNGALDTAAKALDAVSSDQPPVIAAARDAMQGRLAALRNAADSATPVVAAEIARQAGEIALRSSHLGVRAACLKAGANPNHITYGVETSLRKLLRHEPFRGRPGGPVQLDAGGGEMDAAQLALFAYDAPLLNVRVETSDLACEGKPALPAAALRVRRVGYVPTVKPSYAVDYVGLWPDPLMPYTPFDVQPGTFETLWVDVRVPRGTPAGVYRGKLRLVALNSEPTDVPFEVRVRGFTIPVKHSVVTAFGVSPSWRVKQDSDAFIRNALEHRITPYTVAPAPTLVSPPALDWKGATTLEVRVKTDSPGTLTLNLTFAGKTPPRSLGPEPVAASQDAQVRFALGDLPGPIVTWRLMLAGPREATATARLETANGGKVLCDNVLRRMTFGEDGWLKTWPVWSGSGWDAPDVPATWDWAAFDQAMETYLPLGVTSHIAQLREPLGGWAAAFQQHLRERGWLDYFYTYLFDEPEPKHYPHVNDLLRQVKQGAPGIRNMMTARSFPPELRFVDVWCPEAYSFDPVTAKAEQQKGKTIWWYVAFSTRHPYPDVWIDYPAIDCRVWPWMTWKHDIDGMLYWSVTYWSRNDPWRCGESFPGGNGDGSMLYPGEDGKPVDSLRWECLRDGMEDFEVFCLLDAGAQALQAANQQPELVAKAMALCAIDDRVVKSYKEYNPDPAALVEARRQMSDTLEQIVAALGREPAIAGRPRYRPPVDMSGVLAEAGRAEEAAPETIKPWQSPAAQPEPDLVLRYDFDDAAPFAVDLSGGSRHGLASGIKRCAGVRGQALNFPAKGGVTLPAGAELLGPQPESGTVTVWARSAFQPQDLAADTWNGYAVLFYLMESDGNGLPDGFDEIGVYAHGPQLLARCGGSDAQFAAVPSPLKAGTWSHIALTWSRTRRALYVDGKPVVVREGAFQLPKLDAFPAALGRHAPREQWCWNGDLDEFRIYRRTLTDAEIATLAAGKP